MPLQSISPGELARKQQQGEAIDLIDVRTPVEFREIHSSYARNIPLTELDPHRLMSERKSGDERPLYFICRSGSRSQQACEKMIAAGMTLVVFVEGGTLAWEQAGLPVIRGNKAISLERQVRIAAGSLMLVGTVLGFFVHPYCLGLAAFVGAGLVFAGITDTCGMGLLLARMPWNQVKPGTPAGAHAPACAASAPPALPTP